MLYWQPAAPLEWLFDFLCDNPTVSSVSANSLTSVTWYFARTVLCVLGSGDRLVGGVDAVVLLGCKNMSTCLCGLDSNNLPLILGPMIHHYPTHLMRHWNHLSRLETIQWMAYPCYCLAIYDVWGVKYRVSTVCFHSQTLRRSFNAVHIKLQTEM